MTVQWNEKYGVHVRLFGQKANGTDQQLADVYGGGIPTIASEHMRVHNGKGWIHTEKTTIDASGGVHDNLLVVPAGVYPHLRLYSVVCDVAPLDIQLFEGTTYSATGAEHTQFNMNRNSTNVAGMKIYDSPTLLTTGTQIQIDGILGSKQSGGEGDVLPIEWILKGGTDYLLRVTNNAAGIGNLFIKLFHYEDGS